MCGSLDVLGQRNVESVKCVTEQQQKRVKVARLQ